MSNTRSDHDRAKKTARQVKRSPVIPRMNKPEETECSAGAPLPVRRDKMIEVTLSNNRDAFVLNNDVPSGVTLKIPEVIMNKSVGSEIAINRRVINLSDGKVTQIIEESIKVE